MEDSLLHFAANAHLREHSILEDGRDPLALLHCKSGERKCERDRGEYPCCQRKSCFRCPQGAATPEFVGEVPRLAHDGLELWCHVSSHGH